MMGDVRCYLDIRAVSSICKREMDDARPGGECVVFFQRL